MARGLHGAACMTESAPSRYQTWVCTPLLPPLPHHKQSSWIKSHFHFKLLMAFLVISSASFPVVLQVHMKSHFVSYYRIFSSLLRYSSAFRVALCVMSFLGSSWPLILQDPFVPGAQRSHSSLKAHSRMYKPSSFTLPNLQDTAAKLLCLFRVNSL